MKKSEAEVIIKRLITEWIILKERAGYKKETLNYWAFKTWAESNGHQECFNFRTTRSPDSDAEDWFDRQTNQLSMR